MNQAHPFARVIMAGATLNKKADKSRGFMYDNGSPPNIVAKVAGDAISIEVLGNGRVKYQGCMMTEEEYGRCHKEEHMGRTGSGTTCSGSSRKWLMSIMEKKKKEHRGRPRKRNQGTPEKVRGMLFENMERLNKIAEASPDELEKVRQALHGIAQGSAQWMKLTELIDVQKELKEIRKELLALRQAQGMKKVA